MPLTFAHPAAVIPLRRVCPRFLCWSALVIGAVCPDFDYFLTLSTRAGPGHTVPGAFYFCLPLGLVSYLLFHVLLKRPLTLLLPVGERQRLWDLAVAREPMSVGLVLRVAASVVLGAWTHLAWDSFTHPGRWGTLSFPVLNRTVTDIGGYEVTLFRVLQHGSTLFGVLALAWLYLRWRRRARLSRELVPDLNLLARGVALLAILAAGLVGGAVFASSAMPNPRTFPEVRSWIGSFVVSGISFGSLAVVVVGAVLAARESRWARAWYIHDVPEDEGTAADGETE